MGGKVNSSSGTPLLVFVLVKSNHTQHEQLAHIVRSDASLHPKWLVGKPQERELYSFSKVKFTQVQFSLGPPASGSPHHHHTHAYASLFKGKKRWRFYAPPGSMISRKHARNLAAEDAALRESLPLAASHQEANARQMSLPCVCDQLPGDVIYVPHGWGHSTLNEETSVSVTHEFSWNAE